MISGQDFSDMVLDCHSSGYDRIFVSATTFIEIKSLVKDNTKSNIIKVVDRETKAPMLFIEAYEVLGEAKSYSEQTNPYPFGSLNYRRW